MPKKPGDYAGLAGQRGRSTIESATEVGSDGGAGEVGDFVKSNNEKPSKTPVATEDGPIEGELLDALVTKVEQYGDSDDEVDTPQLGLLSPEEAFALLRKIAPALSIATPIGALIHEVRGVIDEIERLVWVRLQAGEPSDDLADVLRRGLSAFKRAGEELIESQKRDRILLTLDRALKKQGIRTPEGLLRAIRNDLDEPALEDFATWDPKLIGLSNKIVSRLRESGKFEFDWDSVHELLTYYQCGEEEHKRYGGAKKSGATSCYAQRLNDLKNPKKKPKKTV